VRSICTIARAATSFCLGLDPHGIVIAVIQVIGSECLAALNMADLDVMEAKIQETSMIHKGIVRLCGHLTPFQKKEEDYRSVVSTYLSLKKAASLCRHPRVVG